MRLGGQALGHLIVEFQATCGDFLHLCAVAGEPLFHGEIGIGAEKVDFQIVSGALEPQLLIGDITKKIEPISGAGRTWDTYRRRQGIKTDGNPPDRYLDRRLVALAGDGCADFNRHKIRSFLFVRNHREVGQEFLRRLFGPEISAIARAGQLIGACVAECRSGVVADRRTQSFEIRKPAFQLLECR